MAAPVTTLYRAHWEDPLTRFFEQLFGPLEWNTIAIQDCHQCVWYSYFHPYPIWISNSTTPISHPWLTLIEKHQLSHAVTLTFNHQPVDFVQAIVQYGQDQYSGGLQVVSNNLGCTVDVLINFPYRSIDKQDSVTSSEVPVELVDIISRWMSKASKALVTLAALDQHWYQQRLQLQPVDGRWWHQLVQRQQQLIKLLRDGISTGTISCAEMQAVLPFDVPSTSITFTTPFSIPVVHVLEPVLLQHYQELSKLVDIINDR